MLFQTFDDKQQCILAFQDDKFFKDLEGLHLSRTWSYAPYLEGREVEYAQLWVHGQRLGDVCPQRFQEELNRVEESLKAIIRSCQEASIDLDKLCFFEFVPPVLLNDYACIKNKICEHIFATFPKPPNYDHLLKIMKVVTQIKQRPLEIDFTPLPATTVRDRNITRTLKECQGKIIYDAFKTKTGRLTTIPGSFPVLTLSKEYRVAVKPTHQWLFELDFNAAELRTILALLSHSQPSDDLHEWNINNLFGKKIDRETAKKRIFAWLYNPTKEDEKINAVYNREKVKALYYKDEQVITPYHRVIECDDYHALNYIIQSTTADMLFEQMYAVWKLLQDKRSFIKFCNHDSIIIDLAAEDESLVHSIKETFAQTRFGRFKVNCTGGKNWGDMKKLNIR